jgi:hypothetical protein
MANPSAKKLPDHHRTLTHAEWQAEAEARFGKDPMRWAFKCPVCGYVATLQDWKDAGAKSEHAAFSCVGRWLPGSGEAFTGKPGGTRGPCNYAGGGLFRINPVHVSHEGGETSVFEFATPEEVLAKRVEKAGQGEA